MSDREANLMHYLSVKHYSKAIQWTDGPCMETGHERDLDQIRQTGRETLTVALLFLKKGNSRCMNWIASCWGG